MTKTKNVNGITPLPAHKADDRTKQEKMTLVTYETAKARQDDRIMLNRAYDILFEEMVKLGSL